MWCKHRMLMLVCGIDTSIIPGGIPILQNIKVQKSQVTTIVHAKGVVDQRLRSR